MEVFDLKFVSEVGKHDYTLINKQERINFFNSVIPVVMMTAHYLRIIIIMY